MCLLELPLRLHLNPNASARSVFALPHVATTLGPGPTSEPGGLIVCLGCCFHFAGNRNAPRRATTLRPSSATSPYEPLRTCHARSPSQSPNVGACANSQGHGMLHLQTSNQSPSSVHLEISAMASLL